MDVVVDHDAVMHALPATLAVEVNSPCPKLRPSIVTDVEPVNGRFGRISEIAAASNEKMSAAVPADELTVTCTKPG
jgi:hypothetical protein